MPKTPSLIVILLAILACACTVPADRNSTSIISPQPDNSLVDDYPIDPIFQGLYDFLGGEAVAGPGITPLIESGDRKSQYIQAGQLVYDPLAPKSDRFQLESLGHIFGIAEPPVPDPGIQGGRYVNGHIILSEFLPMYEKLGGARVVGRPLTERRHNPERRRIEQYFENLGFYRLENEQPGTVHLMAYGAMACPVDCRSQPPMASIPNQKTYLPPAFSSAASHLGLDVTGLTLSSPHLDEDGKLEVIFENLVMTLDVRDLQDTSENRLSQIRLPETLVDIQDIKQYAFSLRQWLPVIVKITSVDRLHANIKLQSLLWLPLVGQGNGPEIPSLHLKPIVQMLGYEPQPPVPRKDDPLMVFYKIEGEMGHNVPVLFDEYLNRFGGISFVGNPITEVFYTGNDVYRQCFTNLCLDFEPTGVNQLHLTPLGVEYKQQYYSEPETKPIWQEHANLRLSINEEKAFIAPGESQEIQAVITERNVPLTNREPILTVSLPDGTQQIFQMKPTDELGTSTYRLPPIQAKNATLIPYKVCLSTPQGEQLCVEDNYLVWDSNQ